MDNDTAIDASERFVRYLCQCERNLRAFIAAGIQDFGAVDEILQTTSLVMWRKFSEFDVDGARQDFLNWAFAVARFEIRKYRTRMARDPLVLSEDVYRLLEETAQEAALLQDDRERALEKCLAALNPVQRDLMRAIYAGNQSIKDIAVRSGRSPTALYKQVARIQDMLQVCIENKLRTLNWEGTQ